MTDKPVKLHEKLPYLAKHKLWAEIDISALKYNYRVLRDGVNKYLPDTKMMAVVKADAYGHGIEPCATALYEEGCRCFAVSCIDEAIALREVLDGMEDKSSIRDSKIIILGYTLPTQATLLAKYRIATAILDMDYAEKLDRAAKDAGVTVDVHIALDTGMNRVGFTAQGFETGEHTPEEVADGIEKIYSLSSLNITGMFTHFARADEEYGDVMREGSHTLTQYGRYARVLNCLLKRGHKLGLCHVCNSAATVRFPEMVANGRLASFVGEENVCGMDAVRLGIMLYGVRPSEHISNDLRPVMSLKTIVTHIHTLQVGESVSYGGCFKSDTPRRIATLPVGYADGFVRAYSGAEVTVHTKDGDFRAPIIGRICMDQCMIDITDMPDSVKVGDTVTLFGESRGDIEALAARAGTIEYECLCLISARVPRVLVGWE